MARKKKEKHDIKKAKKFFRYLKPYRGLFAVGWFFLVMSSLTAMAFPYLLGQLFGNAAGDPTDTDSLGLLVMKNATQVVTLLFIVFAAQSFFSFFRIFIFTRVTEKTLYDLRKDAFGHLVRLPVDFFNKNKVGELTSRIATDVNLLQETLNTTIAEFFRQFITILVAVIMLSLISVKLALIMLAIVPVVAIIAVFFGRFIKKLSKQAQDEAAASNAILEESLNGIQNVKSFTNETFEVNRYTKTIDAIKGLNIKNGTWRGLFVSFIIFCMFGAIVFVIWRGVILVQNGEIAIGDFVSFILYTIFMGASFGAVPDLYAKIQKAIGASEKLMEMLEEEEELKNDSSPTLNFTGEVQFKNIAFSYPQREEIQVLKDISFHARSGERIALVGASGAGKTTMIQLLLKFYESDEGEILFDGESINNIPLHTLRQQMGWVPQDVFLFGGTIQENIAYGKPEATEEEIKAAAIKANAWNFIQEFPDGMDTIVGNRGIQLSGGQRQRVAIARAVLKDPKILLLDEATSALDSENEKLVQDALDELMKNRTSFVIAHRLSTIKNADRILVMDKGEIIESGTHLELSQKESGTYKKLLELQLQSS